MHIHSRITKIICTLLCALTIVSCIGNVTLIAQASDIPFAGQSATYLEKLIDMALSKAGVIAEEAVIDKVKNEYINFLMEAGDGYLTYLKDNGIEDVSIESWKAYINQSSYPEWRKNFMLTYPEIAVNYYGQFQENIDNIIISEEEALYALGITDAKYGKQYTLPSVAVNFFRNLFENRKAEIAPYIMIPTYSPDTIPASAFTSGTYYNNFRSVLGGAGDNLILLYNIYDSSQGAISAYGRTTMFRFSDTTNSLFGNIGTGDALYTNVSFYNSSWTESLVYYDGVCDVADYATFREKATNGSFGTFTIYNSTYSSTSGLECRYICTSDGRNIPFFKDLASLKAYDAGQSPYYTTRTYNNWDSSTDNSITYTGDYLIDNSTERTYTTINSSEDYSQTNIDNSVTNITNNYIYTNPDAPSDDNEEDNNETGESDDNLSLGDALAIWVTALKEFIIFALNLLGEAVNLISGFLNDALSLLSGLTDSFSGFTALLGDMFGFIPQEVVDALSAGIILIIVLGVIKGLKG